MQFSESLKKNQDFQRVYRAARSKANRYLVLYRLENELGKNRLGISVSKKVGNSVVRHHMCRLLRESYRLNESLFSAGYDLVVVVRPQAKDRSFHEIQSALLHLMKLQGILKPEEASTGNCENEKNINRID
jgi:ribonuclease P protein component